MLYGDVECLHTRVSLSGDVLRKKKQQHETGRSPRVVTGIARNKMNETLRKRCHSRQQHEMLILSHLQSII